MHGKCRILLALILWLALAATVCAAATWPKIGAALDHWDGVKKISLRTTLADPLASPIVQDLLETLLDKGFTVTPLPVDAKVKVGLALDLRQTGNRPSLTLSQADGTIIAFERQGTEAVTPAPPAATSAPSAVPTPSPATPKPEKSLSTTPVMPVPSGPIELPGHPRQIVLLDTPNTKGVRLMLQADEGLTAYQVSTLGLEKLESYPSPEKGFRALHLDAESVGEGGVKLAAVWGEDVQDIYAGTNTRLHGWVLTAEGGSIQPVSKDLGSYLRLYAGRGYLQERGAHKLFAGPVLPLVEDQGRYQPGSQSVAWWRNLLEETPLNGGEMLVTEGDGSVYLESKSTAKKVPGGQLLESLGPFRGPEVAVRLKEPEYRSGFGKEDRVTEIHRQLPARVVAGVSDSVYTLYHQRTPGLPLLGKPTGKDALVRIVRSPQGLRLEHPFAGVEAYIEDFALCKSPSGTVLAVLLMNEKEDGTGNAYLLFQQPGGE
jgi:hypothetical protein